MSSFLHSLVLLSFQGLGPLSVGMYDFLLPVISMSTDVQTGDAHVYLLEDGLELWLATLNHAPNPTQQLLQLFGWVKELMSAILFKLLKYVLPLPIWNMRLSTI